MRFIKVLFSDGHWVETSINGTDAEICNYYLGQWFNNGISEDRMTRGLMVMFID